MTLAKQILWRVGTWIPVLFCFNEYAIGVESSPIINSSLYSVNVKGLIIVSRRARTKLGSLVIFESPAGGGNVGMATIKGLPGDLFRDNSHVRRLEAGELWVEAGEGGNGAIDSRDFGPLPHALVRGTPIGEISLEDGWKKWVPPKLK